VVEPEVLRDEIVAEWKDAVAEQDGAAHERPTGSSSPTARRKRVVTAGR
jgi:hypothetical protein